VRIVFFVQNFAVGGVVRQIATQAEHFERRGHTVALVGLFELDEEWKVIWQDRAAPVEALLGPPRRNVFHAVVTLIGATRRLRRMLEDEQVEVLYAYHGNVGRFVAWLATRRLGTTPVWGLRGAGRTYSLRRGWRHALAFHLCKQVSGSIPLLISNSDAARERRAASGFRCRTQLTIPNGFDTDSFRPNPGARARVRSDWGIAEYPLVGLVARLDVPHKGHRDFLEAAALVARRSEAHFVIVGDVPGQQRAELQSLADELGVSPRVHWAGFRGDMPAVYNALDILCSASRWEGFSNVIGEAMASGVPCVVTDAGDSAKLVGDSGIVVPWGNPKSLADAIRSMVERLPELDPLEIRGLITSRFTVDRCVDATIAALAEARASA
jgi:glycosyltransferase involved in cell wall biosynthesis